jgi:hypothetical protein
MQSAAAIVCALALALALALAFVAQRRQRREAFGPPAVRMASNPFNVAGPPVQSFATTMWPDLLKAAPRAPPLFDGAPIELLCDPDDAAKHYAGMRGVPAARAGHFLLLTAPNRTSATSVANWAGARVGYTDRSELLLALSLMTAARLSPRRVTLVWVPKPRFERLSEALADDVDVVVAYVVRDSAFFDIIARQTLNAAGFGAAGVSVDTVNVTAPEEMEAEGAALVRAVRFSYPHVQADTVPLGDWFGPGAAVVVSPANQRAAVLLRMTQVWVQLGARRGAHVERFVTQYVWDAEALDARFACVGGAVNAPKAECDSAFDAAGLPKRTPTAWDRRCESDEECPYVGEGGGCRDGSCDLPVGVLRLSFRQAAGGEPLCDAASGAACSPVFAKDGALSVNADATEALRRAG